MICKEIKASLVLSLAHHEPLSALEGLLQPSCGTLFTLRGPSHCLTRGAPCTR